MTKKLFVLICIFLVATGCRRSQQTGTADLHIDLIAPLFPTVEGSPELTMQVTDSNGTPVEEATLAIKGDMTHAGMVPVLAEVSGGEQGTYRVPLQWTMAGDWIVTVRATLPDGTWAERQFELAVTAGEHCEVEEDDK